MARYAKTESREWARETLRGVCDVVIPSYTADLRGLNERGIRHDVARQQELGFLGALLVSETALTLDEYVRFTEWSVDEANGNLLLIHHASFNTLEENIEAVRRCEVAGAELVLLTYPPSFRPRSENDIYDYTAAFCNSTNLAVMLFPLPYWGFEGIHPSSLSVDLVERLVQDCSNVAVVKAEGGAPSIGGFAYMWDRFSDRLVVTMPIEQDAIPLATLVPMQLIATSNTEYYGAEVPQQLALVHEGKISEAMERYWRMYPARKANESGAPIPAANMVNRAAWKYQAWLAGFNGGPLRMPSPRLNPSQMATFRRGLENSGLEVTSDSDELYFEGRFPA